jgi:4-hydroxythreonine-4-phosphate dehydrogenase
MFKPIVGITMGDPAGIGPEVIIKALKSGQLDELCHPLILGSSAVMRRMGGENLPILDCTKVDLRRIRPGRVSRWTGQAAAETLLASVRMATAGFLGAVVTAPVSKQALHLAGHRYPGQTELLAELTKTQHFAMMLTTGNLRVTLVTTHVALGRVRSALSRARLESTIRVTHSALEDLFGIRQPRMAVCALNPHAGEGGLFGHEEKRIIAPTIREISRQGISIEGPLPADTLFAPAMRRQFDVIVAMYHDQGLIPIKMIGFGRAVNITLGLPIIRTSPDHGTALDIAGQGKASPKSMIQAIKMAAQLARRRRKRLAKAHG